MKPSVLSTLSAKMQSGQKRRSTGCIVYFDLEREDWRCFRPENFLSIL
ncbi:MAG: SH3 beta-barrel fold-containing protein [Alistipes sp.]